MDKDDDLGTAFVCIMMFTTTLLNLYEYPNVVTKTGSGRLLMRLLSIL